MRVVVRLEEEQEEVKEEGCGRCHEKLTQGQCSLKVTLLLQQKKKKKKGFSHFLHFSAITDTDLIKLWPKESCCFLGFASF